MLLKLRVVSINFTRMDDLNDNGHQEKKHKQNMQLIDLNHSRDDCANILYNDPRSF